jgi:enoyl-[acyl-carrier protein] reductase II
VRNDWTTYYEQHPDELAPFPQQAAASMQAGVNHLGAPTGTEVDVRREFMPCGQGVGAIDDLPPAGELVRRILDEALDAIDRVARLRG